MLAAVDQLQTELGPMEPKPADAFGSLIERVAQHGDREAFALLFNYFGPRIKAMMIKSGAQPAFAEDLAQEVLLTVWRKANLYTPDRGLAATWIYAIARNLRIDRLRKQSARAHEDIDDIDLADDAPNGEQAATSNQATVDVSRAIALLPDDQRRVIELSYIHDLAHGEIATQLSIPVGTVKSRLRLAYEKLRTELERWR